MPWPLTIADVTCQGLVLGPHAVLELWRLGEQTYLAPCTFGYSHGPLHSAGALAFDVLRHPAVPWAPT